MVTAAIIRESNSPWASRMMLVRKEDGSTRFCVDYRKLNNVTRKDAFPLPRIDQALDSLGDATVFSALDLQSGYWQVSLFEDAKSKTAFATPFGLYELNEMPFGLSNAPVTFQRLTEVVLRGLTFEIALIYLDDIIVFASSMSQHLQRLRMVFQ